MLALVVDDNQGVRDLISTVLALEGVEVELAEDGERAWQRLLLAPPVDVVTLDLGMRLLDGVALLQRLAAELPDHPPVVVVTARAQESDRSRALELGAAAFVSKPFDPDDLVAVVIASAGGSPPQ